MNMMSKRSALPRLVVEGRELTPGLPSLWSSGPIANHKHDEYQSNRDECSSDPVDTLIGGLHDVSGHEEEAQKGDCEAQRSEGPEHSTPCLTAASARNAI